jgi:osmotically-inducible protein OsmY
MSKNAQDSEIGHRIRRELNRRPVDSSRVQTRVAYGVVYLSGELRPIRGTGVSLKQELETIKSILLHIPGVREVSDYTLRLSE